MPGRRPCRAASTFFNPYGLQRLNSERRRLTGAPGTERASLAAEDFVLEESSSCYSCGHVTNEVVSTCPKCGRRLRTAKQVRRLGWLQLAIGVFLVGLMGTITYNLAPLMFPLTAETGDRGARFTGTPEQAQLILALFGMVIAFGLGSIFSGLWQIKTGRRNKWLFIGMVLLFIVLIFFSWYLRSALRGAS